MPAPLGARPGRLGHTHIGWLPYPDFLRLAGAMAAGRAEGRLPDMVLTTTHPPVVTLGRDTGPLEGELRLSPAEAGRRGIPVVPVDRGGRATYHGPGQLMVYPVVDLRALGVGAADFAALLVEAVRAALAGAPWLPRLVADRGLWAEGAKLASVGLAVRGGLTSHGLALNLEPEPAPGFGTVFPCGDPATRVTDLRTLTGRRLDRRALGEAVAAALGRVLGLETVPLAAEDLASRKPPWLVLRATGPAGEGDNSMPPTVCAAADCPNQAACSARGRATYLLLGPSCTRACAFCRVPDGLEPAPPDPDEPERVARAVAAVVAASGGAPGAPAAPAVAGRGSPRTGPHVVLTSVTRDDLPDGGAALFAAAVRAVRRRAPGACVEVLLPDFRGKPGALATVLEARPDVVGHNLETVPRLYRRVRPGASYATSLGLIRDAAAAGAAVRSGLLLGLGEDGGEVLAVLRDLAAAGCRHLWLGQYLRPTPAHHPVARYARPAEFALLAARARALGFAQVAAGPLVRSSCSGGDVLSPPAADWGRGPKKRSSGATSN